MPEAGRMRLLRVDLRSARFDDQDIPREDQVKYLGGRGLAARLLYVENKPKVGPFDPENRLIIMTGPYTGTLGSFTGFYNITTKSPLTGAILSAHSGGHWGPMLRKTGYDGIVFKGRAPAPTYLSITDAGPELKDASDLWGKDVFETTGALEERHEAAKALVIGPGGENKVRFAAIMNDKHRAAGRGGVGAVMGSKNLKAVVVHGTRDVPQADPEKLRESFKTATATVKEKSQAFMKYGTSMVVGITGKAGTIPTRNLQTGYFPEFEKIGGDALVNDHVNRSIACARCPLHCGKETKAEKDYSVVTEGPEYETLAMFGSNLGNSNLESIIMANDLCNMYGMDTISCADTIACAFELFEKGIIGEKDTDGLKLDWGDHQAMVQLVEMTGKGEGFGRLIGEGSRRLAAKYGPEAYKYAMNVKGMEFPGYDPRGIQGMSLAFATSTRGACHLRATMYVPELFQGVLDRFTVKGKAQHAQGHAGAVHRARLHDPLQVRRQERLREQLGQHGHARQRRHRVRLHRRRPEDRWACGSGPWSGCSTCGRGCRGRTTRSPRGSSRRRSTTARRRARSSTRRTSRRSSTRTTRYGAGPGRASRPGSLSTGWASASEAAPAVHIASEHYQVR